jgi:hypothetical protein
MATVGDRGRGFALHRALPQSLYLYFGPMVWLTRLLRRLLVHIQTEGLALLALLTTNDWDTSRSFLDA